MTSDEPVPQRIGFEERDAAIEALQEHHSLGRLDATEFEERMTKALQARTAPELAVLFRDLPGPSPVAMPSPPHAGPAGPVTLPSAQDGSGRVSEWSGPDPTPWYAQWWMILVAVGITVASRGNVGFIIPMMAIWLWVIYPSVAASAQRKHRISRGTYAERAAQLPDWQRRRIVEELGRGRKIPAIKLYREYTGANLQDAKETVEHIQRQIEG